MIHLKEQYQDHDRNVDERMKAVLEFRNKKAEICISDVNYWTFGELQELIPEDYYTNPASSMDYQIKKIKYHMSEFSDDLYQPFLHPWFGTGVLASAFDVPLLFNYKSDPAADLVQIDDISYIDKLELPVPGESGGMKLVRESMDYYKANCDLTVGLTDCQGPLATAFQVVGYEKFCYWVYDDPKRIHLLMEKITQALINWVYYQKERAGTPKDGACYCLGVKTPDGYGGVWLADDDSVIVSGEMYAEFVKPYNEKILQEFGGGVIHYCGDSSQNVENYANTKGIFALHNMHMDNMKAARLARETAAKKGIAYMAGDFVPADHRYKDYYNDLIEAMGGPEGLIICPYVAPAVALDAGKYESSHRDGPALARDVHRILRDITG